MNDRTDNPSDTATSSGTSSGVTAVRSRVSKLWTSLLSVPTAIRRSYLLRFALSLLLVVVLISFVGVYVQGNVATTLETDLEQQLVLEAESEANQLDGWLRNTELPARLVSKHPALNGDSETMSAYLEEQKTDLPDRVVALHVVDTSQAQIVASSSRDRINDSVAEKPWMDQRSFSGFDDVTTSDPYRRNDSVVLGFVSPVPEQNRRILVTVVDTQSVEFGEAIEGTFTSVVRPTIGSTEVIFSDSPDRQKRLTPYITGANSRDIPEVRVGVSGQSGFVRNATVSRSIGENHVASYAPVNGTDWVLIRHAPASSAYSLSDRSQQGFIIVVTIALVGVLVVGATVGRNTALSLRNLSQKAHEIESGNYETELESERADEIGQLYDSIGSMRDAIDEHIQETEQRNEQLLVMDRLLRHNIKNDMNVIELRSQSIKDEASPTISQHTDEILHTVETVLEKTEKQRIITQVLSSESEQSVVDICGSLREALNRLEEASSPICIDSDLPESAQVTGSYYLGIALTELIENAVVHNDSETPSVAVTVTKHEASVEIEITDNGPAIPDAGRNILRGSQDIDPLSHSTGIGLWLVYQIVNVSDGKIEYQRSSDEKNSVRLTLKRPTDAPAQ